MEPVEELTLLIKAAQREGDRRVNAALRPIGLTAAQAEVLLVLAAAEPLSLGDLGDLLVAEGGHPSRLVDRMVGAGWIERTTAQDDRRRLELRLTPLGRELAADAFERKRRLIRESGALLVGTDHGALRELLTAYLGDGPWAQTVQRRRALDARRTADPGVLTP